MEIKSINLYDESITLIPNVDVNEVTKKMNNIDWHNKIRLSKDNDSIIVFMSCNITEVAYYGFAKKEESGIKYYLEKVSKLDELYK
jgi:hypothetical protein